MKHAQQQDSSNTTAATSSSTATSSHRPQHFHWSVEVRTNLIFWIKYSPFGRLDRTCCPSGAEQLVPVESSFSSACGFLFFFLLFLSLSLSLPSGPVPLVGYYLYTHRWFQIIAWMITTVVCDGPTLPGGPLSSTAWECRIQERIDACQLENSNGECACAWSTGKNIYNSHVKGLGNS